MTIIDAFVDAFTGKAEKPEPDKLHWGLSCKACGHRPEACSCENPEFIRTLRGRP